MSFDLTPEKLQGLAIKCAAMYMTKQASLSEAISKEAQVLELNPDQIKRTIEATNTITYLRQLEDSKDRTLEFPLADYKEVMAHMVLPEKQAAEEGKEEREDDEGQKSEDDEDKKEKEQEDSEKTASLFSDQEKIAMISKETMRCTQVMEKIASEKIILHMGLESLASKVSLDPLAFEKIALATGEDAPVLSKLCGLEKAAKLDNVFSDAELLEVKELHGIYKQAVELVSQESDIIEFLEKSSSVLGSLGNGIMHPIDSAKKIPSKLGEGAGWTAKKLTNLAVSPITSPVKNMGKFRNAAKAKGLSTSEAVKHFDAIKGSAGTEAAKKAFGGVKPGIISRKGILGGLSHAGGLAGDVFMGTTIPHDVSVWQSLQKSN